MARKAPTCPSSASYVNIVIRRNRYLRNCFHFALPGSSRVLDSSKHMSYRAGVHSKNCRKHTLLEQFLWSTPARIDVLKNYSFFNPWVSHDFFFYPDYSCLSQCCLRSHKIRRGTMTARSKFCRPLRTIWSTWSPWKSAKINTRIHVSVTFMRYAHKRSLFSSFICFSPFNNFNLSSTYQHIIYSLHLKGTLLFFSRRILHS